MAEVGHLHVVVEQEQVLRFDVEVLQLVLVVHEVEDFGRLAHVLEQFFARDAGQAGFAVFAEALPKVAIGEFHDDDEPAFDDVVAVEGQQVRVPDGLDPFEGFQLLLGEAVGVVVLVAEIAVDHFGRFENPAGGFAAPDLAEAAAAQAVHELVAGDRF